MATTVHYRNAIMLVQGADISGRVYDLSVTYTCETLDNTGMGQTTRTHQGGLFSSDVSGKVWFESGAGLSETVLFPLVGVDDIVLSIYPDGITQGSSAAGSGYALRGVCKQFDIGGAVGTLLPITFSFSGRGYGV